MFCFFGKGYQLKNLSTVQETRVRSLDWEDPLEEEMATHSSLLAWEIPWTEEPGGLRSGGHEDSDTTEQLNHCCHQLSSLRTLLVRAWGRCSGGVLTHRSSSLALGKQAVD